MNDHRYHCGHDWPAFVQGRECYQCTRCRSTLMRNRRTGAFESYTWHDYRPSHAERGHHEPASPL